MCKNKYESQTWNTAGIIDVERRNMVSKYKITEAVNLTLHGHYTCVYSFQTY